MATFVVADIDPANERDDEQAIALLLADQTRFNIVGLVADAPDGVTTGYGVLTAAYEADRAKLETATGNTGLFLTQAQLDARTVQGSQIDNPSAGYWTAAQWESNANAMQAHNAAQAMIAAAQAHGSTAGSPQTNPLGKLWVFVQGGFTTIAQALYEAIDLGQLPDIIDRCGFMFQSTHNSYVTRNAWRYINVNQWQAADVPGKFGTMWAVDGNYLATGLNRLNGGTDQELWNGVTYGSAMGARLEVERAASNYTERAFRAGDASFWFWLSEAMRLGSYDPTNAANRMGPYRTYQDGQGFPYNRASPLWGPRNRLGGWPTGPGMDPLYSPTRWAPVESVDSIAAGIAALDLDSAGGWYDNVRQVMGRYRGLEGVRAYSSAEFLMNAGASATTQIIESVEGDASMTLGANDTVETFDPIWTARGLTFDGTQIARGTRTTLMDRRRVTVAAVIRPSTTAAGTRQIVTRDDSVNSALWQFRQNGSALEFVGRGASATVVASPSGALVADVDHLVVAHIDLDSLTVRLRINGVTVATGTLVNAVPTGGGARLLLAHRVSSGSPTERFIGEISYLAMFDSVPLNRLPEVEALARSRVALKGITV